MLSHHSAAILVTLIAANAGTGSEVAAADAEHPRSPGVLPRIGAESPTAPDDGRPAADLYLPPAVRGLAEGLVSLPRDDISLRYAEIELQRLLDVERQRLKADEMERQVQDWLIERCFSAAAAQPQRSIRDGDGWSLHGYEVPLNAVHCQP